MIEYHIIILDFGETEIAIKGEESHFEFLLKSHKY